MTFVQATTGSGGWPMSVWLTPDLKPFYGGTYFPPASRWGRPGFVDILQRDRARVAGGARQGRAVGRRADGAAARRSSSARPTAAMPGADGARRGRCAQFRAGVRSRGTAGSATRRSSRGRASCCSCCASTREPATPTARDDGARARCARWRSAACAITSAAASIATRSTRAWRVPHFEKMLYDQAQLVLAYLEGGAGVRRSVLRARSPRTRCAYVLREMTDEAGGFYSAEDADSVPPEQAGEPGAHKSGRRVLPLDAPTRSTRCSATDARDRQAAVRHRAGRQRAVRSAAGVHRQEPALRRAVGRRARRASRHAARDEVVEMLNRARARACSSARLQRPRPHLDDKMLTAWNGLMIAAFARAARVLRGARAGRRDGRRAVPRQAAQRAAAFIRERMWNARRRARCCAAIATATPSIDGYAEDYAYLIFGLLELFQADPRSGVARVGRSRCSAGRTSCSGTRPTAAGSARPAAIRACCCG